MSNQYSIAHSYEKNAGAFNKKIVIFQNSGGIDADGFPIEGETEVLTTYASVRTTRGMTLIVNDSDFEKAYTNFTIRYPKTEITRDMFIRFKGKTYTINYINNVNEANVNLEMQCKEITP